jgi:predicted phage terminase large subunit-like protein
MTYPFALFHHEMFRITEDSNMKLAVLIAFRGSGKSTLMTLSYVIWSVIGVQQKKFVLILCQTQAQAKLHMANIKRELETNELLKADIGPFEDVSDEWGSTTIVLSNYGARITIASTEQSIRGIRHGEFRPDLVICDDVEDLTSVKTREGRDKTFQWLTGEVLPIGDQNTKIVIVGNLLHEDSLLMRLKHAIDEGKLDGRFFAYPLLSKDNEIAWKDKFPSLVEIEKLRSSIGNDSAWYREYLLRIISDADRLVHPEWIHYYDNLPTEKGTDFRFIATGIDLAISQKDSADYTAMVSAKVYGYKSELKVYILPFPINSRLDFPQTVEQAINLSKNLGNGKFTMLYIEEVGYQSSFIQHLQSNTIPAEGVKVSGQDKRARLALITHLIKQGNILFPKKGAEQLIQQLTGFGIEKHDDLADAFSLLVLKIQELDNKPKFVFFFA